MVAFGDKMGPMLGFSAFTVWSQGVEVRSPSLAPSCRENRAIVEST